MKNSCQEVGLISQFIVLTLCTSAAIFSQAVQGKATAVAKEEFSRSSTSVLEEVVVTARRREESLQSVPISVTAFDQSSIDRRQIDTAQELTHFVPSLVVNAAGSQGTNFTLRGQGSTFFAGPGVITYFSEVPIPTRGVLPGIYHDLESVQVLKGPQGTLFGRNTTGGAVLFEPHRPTSELEGSLELQVGNYDWRQVKGVLNVPFFNNKLLARLSFDVNEREGYIKDVNTGRDYNNIDYWSTRLGLIAHLSESLENYTVIRALDAETNGSGNRLLHVAPSLEPLIGTFLDQQNGRDNDRVAQGPTTPGTRTKLWGVINTTTWDLTDKFILKNIVSYHETESYNAEDLDATPLPLIESRIPDGWGSSNRQITEELQL